MSRAAFYKAAFAIAITIFLSLSLHAQTTAKKIADIKMSVAEADRMATLAEGDDYSSVFIVELNVNPKENQYPAVGTFTSTAKFYYTYGDREKNPYPNRILKIAMTTRRSAMTELTTIYFRGSGEMIFYSKKIDGDESSDRSVYMIAGLPVRFESRGKIVPVKSSESVQFTKEAIAEKMRLMRIFTAAVE